MKTRTLRTLLEAILSEMDEEEAQPVAQQRSVDVTETKVVYGGAIKALDGNGKVGGYLITFTEASDKDLTETYFQSDTYYGPRDGDGADVLFQHGLPVTDAIDPDRLFTPMKTKKDDIGVWAETVLNMADEYEAMVFELVKQGKLGWSSGAPGHMVRMNADGKITRWPIAEGSFTPTPAEPRHRFGHRILPVRALMDQRVEWPEPPQHIIITP